VFFVQLDNSVIRGVHVSKHRMALIR